MSEGPIQQWRDAHKPRKPIPVSERVHAPSTYPNRGYCGTTDNKHQSTDWKYVSCPNCWAAKRADEEAR